MKRLISMAAVMVLFLGMAAAPAAAAEASATLDFASAYVWRGITFNDGFVIQPSIDVAGKNGLGINVWGNYDVDDYDDQLTSNDFSEIDLTVSYGTSFGKLDVGAGVIAYLFPGAGSDSETAEIYLSLGMDIMDGLSAALDIYYDFELLDELSYATLSLAYAYGVSDKLDIEVGGSIGYAGDDFSASYGGADGGLWDYTLSLSLGYAISDAWSASAGVTYVNSLDDDNLIEGNTAGTLDTTTYATVGVAYAF